MGIRALMFRGMDKGERCNLPNPIYEYNFKK
jgi:hypothetical protein